jgi:rhodanese-related sulfurtransferase
MDTDDATHSTHSVTVRELLPLIGTHRWPLVVDVRRAPAYDADPTIAAGAARCDPTRIDALAATIAPGRPVVCYCVHGHEVGRNAAASLRRFGVDARFLEGGNDAWLEAGGPRVRKNARLGVPGETPSRWITRERPKLDRIACPWLVRRFIDPRARFLYVPATDVGKVADEAGAIAFDTPDAPIGHRGDRCSFDALIEAFGLDDPALAALARIVRGADTGAPTVAPQAAGLLALSSGLSMLWADDHAMLEAGLPVYDALYAWCRREVRSMPAPAATDAASLAASPASPARTA